MRVNTPESGVPPPDERSMPADPGCVRAIGRASHVISEQFSASFSFSTNASYISRETENAGLGLEACEISLHDPLNCPAFDTDHSAIFAYRLAHD